MSVGGWGGRSEKGNKISLFFLEKWEHWDERNHLIRPHLQSFYGNTRRSEEKAETKEGRREDCWDVRRLTDKVDRQMGVKSLFKKEKSKMGFQDCVGKEDHGISDDG